MRRRGQRIRLAAVARVLGSAEGAGRPATATAPRPSGQARNQRSFRPELPTRPPRSPQRSAAHGSWRRTEPRRSAPSFPAPERRALATPPRRTPVRTRTHAADAVSHACSPANSLAHCARDDQPARARRCVNRPASRRKQKPHRIPVHRAAPDGDFEPPALTSRLIQILCEADSDTLRIWITRVSQLPITR